MRTSAGLVRFDGVRFVLVEPKVAGRPLDEPIKAISRSAQGDLLVRGSTRTLLYRSGRFSDYRSPTHAPDGDIRLLFESREHGIFLGTDDQIYLLRDGPATMLRNGTGWIYAFPGGRRGIVWIGGCGRTVRLSPWRDLEVRYGSGRPAGTALAEDREKRLWIGTADGLYLASQDRTSMKPVARDAIHGEVNAILPDSDGNLWVGDRQLRPVSPVGRSRLLFLHVGWGDRSQGTESLRGPGGERLGGHGQRTGTLPQHQTDNHHHQRESARRPHDQCHRGARWKHLRLLPGRGLARIRDGVVTALTTKDGLPSAYGNGLFESKDGSLWIGTVGGLTRYRDGKFTVYQAGGRLSEHYISAINEDEESLIVTTSESLALRFKNGKVEPFTFTARPRPWPRPTTTRSRSTGTGPARYGLATRRAFSSLRQARRPNGRSRSKSISRSSPSSTTAVEISGWAAGTTG